MQRDEWSIVALWTLLLVVLGVATWTGVVNATVEAFGTAVAAIISGAVLLLGAILTHALTQLREQRMVQQREMQRNYSAVLSRIGDVIRRSGASDEFSQVHLESWVLGSDEVVDATQRVLKATPAERVEALEALVKAMRKDVGLPKIDRKLEIVFGPREGSLDYRNRS